MDKDQVMPLVDQETRNAVAWLGGQRQRDADWELFQQVWALAERMAEDLSGIAEMRGRCPSCGALTNARANEVDTPTCPVEQFRALKDELEGDPVAPGPGAPAGPEPA